MPELIFETEYQLLQEIGYPYKGAEKKTKNVILKAPTFKEAEKIEKVVMGFSPFSAIVNFICDAGLIVTKEDGNIPIANAFLNHLHFKAYRDLAENYNKFFLASDLPEEKENTKP